MEKDNSNTKQLNEPAATSSKNQETKPPLPKNNIIEIKQTITAAKDLDFVPAIHQIQPVPLFNYQRSRPTYISPFLKFFPAIYQDIYSFKRSEMIFSKEYYEQMKKYLHPNVHKFIHNYTREEDDLFSLAPYHGCSLKNRNGTRKLIDYRNGKQCLFPVWSDGKEIGNSCNRPFTRFISHNGKDRVFFKNKGNAIFNYSTNQYDHLLDTPDRDNFQRFLQIKDTYLKSDQK